MDAVRFVATIPAVACCTNNTPARTNTAQDAVKVVSSIRRGSELHQSLASFRWPRSPGLRFTGPVSDPSNGHYDFRVLGILLPLGPQPLHVHVHQPRVRGIAVPPHLIE